MVVRNSREHLGFPSDSVPAEVEVEESSPVCQGLSGWVISALAKPQHSIRDEKPGERA